MKLDIYKDYKVRNKYRGSWGTWNKRRRSPSLIDEIVIHGTAGGNTLDGLIRWMLLGERAKEYWKSIALFHYGIGREGQIVEVIDPNYYTFHYSFL